MEVEIARLCLFDDAVEALSASDLPPKQGKCVSFCCPEARRDFLSLSLSFFFKFSIFLVLCNSLLWLNGLKPAFQSARVTSKGNSPLGLLRCCYDSILLTAVRLRSDPHLGQSLVAG